MVLAVVEFQQLLAGLAQQLGVRVEQLVSQLGRLDQRELLAFITDAYPDLVAPFLAASADATTTWYDEQPAPDTSFVAAPADLITAEQLGASARWAMLQASPVTALQGSATRSVFAASRDTVIANTEREHIRWARHASANACGFCRLLATRGAVYRTQANAKKSHDHCHCLAVPNRDGLYTPPPYVEQWQRDYAQARSDGASGVSQIATAMDNAPGGRRDTSKASPVTASGTGRPPPPGGNPPLTPAGGEDDGRRKYRAQSIRSRIAQPRYAENLRDVLDAKDEHGLPDERRAQQLADDLGGKYGPFAMQFSRVTHSGTSIKLEGSVWADDGRRAGIVERRFSRDEQGKMVVSNSGLLLEEWAQNKKFSKNLYPALNSYYMRSGVDRVEVHAALDQGGYAWASAGFDWNPRRITESLADVRRNILALIDDAATAGADRQILNEVMSKLDPAHPDLPTPKNLAHLATTNDSELGRKLMTGTSWYGVLYLDAR